MNPRIAKADANQPEIVEAFRARGATVAHTHTVGKGMVDIVVGYKSINLLVEIKDGSKPPSKRKLTTDEQEFHDTWRGTVNVVKCIEEVFEILDWIDRDEWPIC